MNGLAGTTGQMRWSTSKNQIPKCLPEIKGKLSKVVGPGGELVVSALGAMDDHHMLAPGLVTYRSSFYSNTVCKTNSHFSSDGKFKHGFHKSSTGLSK